MNVTKYQSFRTMGVSATVAAAWARTPELSEQFPGVTWEGGWFAEDYTLPNGWLVSIDLECDGESEIDGKWTDQWEHGAIKNPAYRGPGRARVYEWYVPCNTVEEARQSLSRMGYARHEAWRLAVSGARQDAKRDVEGTRYGVRVRVMDANEHVIGTADLWAIDPGTDMESGRQHLMQIARELIAEALPEDTPAFATAA